MVKYKSCDSFDAGYHKTLLRLHDLPEGEAFVFVMHRPCLDVTQRLPVLRETLTSNAQKMGVTEPFFVISSRGFLPGEKIEMRVENMKGESISPLIEFFPEPLMVSSQVDTGQITAEFIGRDSYALHLKGFTEGEVYTFDSRSFGERMRYQCTYAESEGQTYSPSVMGYQGGIAELVIVRKNGEQLRMMFPWGNKLSPILKGNIPPHLKDFPILRITNRGSEISPTKGSIKNKVHYTSAI